MFLKCGIKFAQTVHFIMYVIMHVVLLLYAEYKINIFNLFKQTNQPKKMELKV